MLNSDIDCFDIKLSYDKEKHNIMKVQNEVLKGQSEIDHQMSKKAETALGNIMIQELKADKMT